MANEILFYNLPISDQYWKRLPLPNKFDERLAEEERVRSQEHLMVLNGDRDKITHVDPILERFRRQEFRRQEQQMFLNQSQGARPPWIFAPPSQLAARKL